MELSRKTFMRAGWMAAFDSFENFQDASEDILKLLEDFSAPSTINSKVLEALDAADSASDGARLSTSINVSMSDPSGRSISIDQSEPGKCMSVYIYLMHIYLYMCVSFSNFSSR